MQSPKVAGNGEMGKETLTPRADPNSHPGIERSAEGKPPPGFDDEHPDIKRLLLFGYEDPDKNGTTIEGAGAQAGALKGPGGIHIWCITTDDGVVEKYPVWWKDFCQSEL
jgi:hypothetical protein